MYGSSLLLLPSCLCIDTNGKLNDTSRFVGSWSMMFQGFNRQRLVCTILSVDMLLCHIPIIVLLKIQGVPSSGIQTSGSHFPYHHILFFHFNHMPKICRTTFLYKEGQTRRYFKLKQPRLSPVWYVNSFVHVNAFNLLKTNPKQHVFQVSLISFQ